jgi:hypothetical protein
VGDVVKTVETHQNCKPHMMVDTAMNVTARHYLDDAVVLLSLESP